MTNAIKEKKEVVNFVCNFSNVVKKKNWVPRYDTETDSFSFTVNRLPNDARIKYIGDEVAVYITKDNKVQGIFIEYFKKNFLQHNKDVKVVLKNIKRPKKEEDSLITLDTKKISKKVMNGLEKAMMNSFSNSFDFTTTPCVCK